MKVFKVFDKEDGHFIDEYKAIDEKDLLDTYDISAEYYDIVTEDVAS